MCIDGSEILHILPMSCHDCAEVVIPKFFQISGGYRRHEDFQLSKRFATMLEV